MNDKRTKRTKTHPGVKGIIATLARGGRSAAEIEVLLAQDPATAPFLPQRRVIQKIVAQNRPQEGDPWSITALKPEQARHVLRFIRAQAQSRFRVTPMTQSLADLIGQIGAIVPDAPPTFIAWVAESYEILGEGQPYSYEPTCLELLLALRIWEEQGARDLLEYVRDDAKDLEGLAPVVAAGIWAVSDLVNPSDDCADVFTASGEYREPWLSLAVWAESQMDWTENGPVTDGKV